MSTTRMATIALAAAMLILGVVPASARDRAPAPNVSATFAEGAGVAVIPDSSTSGETSALSIRLRATQPLGDEVSTNSIGVNGESRVVLRYGSEFPQGPGTVSPQFSVGLGWYIYVYLNRGDWIYLAGLGATAASAALCAWLAPTVAAAVACAIAAYIVVTYIVTRSAPSAKQCREFSFTYNGYPVDYKTVKMRC